MLLLEFLVTLLYYYNMFFVKTEGLDPRFFLNPSEHQRSERTAENIHTGPEKLQYFANFVTSAVAPLIREANPVRNFADSSLFIARETYPYEDRYVHTDFKPPKNLTYVTLGVLEDGTTASTMFDKDGSYEFEFPQYLDPEIVKAGFWIPENLWMSVFDPDLELHVSSLFPDNTTRFLYRAALRSTGFETHGAQPLITPKDVSCVDPRASQALIAA